MAASRLWKTLGATKPLFSISSEADLVMDLDDEDITSITLTRGGSDQFGPQTHTLEVDTIRPLSPRTGNPIHCDLTPYGASLIASKLSVRASFIQTRYFGRIGRQIAADHGGNGYEVDLRTSFYASKWQSQLAHSDRLGNQINGESVYYLMDHFMNTGVDANDYQPAAEFPARAADYGRMSNSFDLSEAKITYSEFVSKYLTGPGYYVQNTRAGVDRVLTFKYRYDRALERLEQWMPLTRSQCLSPSQWDQPREDTPRKHKVYWTDSDGQRSIVKGPDSNNVRIPTAEHDISYIRFYDNYQPIRLAWAKYSEERLDLGYYVPSVKIDLLRLISSDIANDRMQARQILQMEMGDAIFLSGDWHPQVAGVMFATALKETINSDAWEVEISLSPSMPVLGDITPDVPPQVWESAMYPWDEEARKWND